MGNKRLQKRLKTLEKLVRSMYGHGGRESRSSSSVSRDNESKSRSRSPRRSRRRSPSRIRRSRSRSRSNSRRRHRHFSHERGGSRREYRRDNEDRHSRDHERCVSRGDYSNDRRSSDSPFGGYGRPHVAKERSLSKDKTLPDVNIDLEKSDKSSDQVASLALVNEKPPDAGTKQPVFSLVPDRVLAPAVRDRLAEIWTNIIIKGFPSEERKTLLKEFPPPVNCLMMDPPKLNLKVKTAIDSTIQKRDERIVEKQEKISGSLSGVSKTIELVLKSNLTEKKQLLESLNGVMRLLADLEHDETCIRRSLILKNIAAPVRDIPKDLPFDNWLFAKDLSEQLKAAKAIQQSSKDLKPYAKTLPGNVYLAEKRRLVLNNFFHYLKLKLMSVRLNI